MTPAEHLRMYQVEARHWWYAGMREILDVLVASVAHDAGEETRVLDAGCGSGFYLKTLGRSAVGVDVSEAALDLCRARGLGNARLASVEALPFAGQSFDRVFALDVLSDRGVRDDLAAMRELCRVLRSGGLLVIRVPALEALRRAHDAAVETERRYSRSGLVRLLERAGLRPLRVTHCNSLLLPLVAFRALADRWRTAPARSDLAPLPPLLEVAFRLCLSVEARLLRGRDLPLGTSLVALAERPA